MENSARRERDLDTLYNRPMELPSRASIGLRTVFSAFAGRSRVTPDTILRGDVARLATTPARLQCRTAEVADSMWRGGRRSSVSLSLSRRVPPMVRRRRDGGGGPAGRLCGVWESTVPLCHSAGGCHPIPAKTIIEAAERGQVETLPGSRVSGVASTPGAFLAGWNSIEPPSFRQGRQRMTYAEAEGRASGMAWRTVIGRDTRKLFSTLYRQTGSSVRSYSGISPGGP